jgi:molecular chaperone DnaK (HSP70)
MSAYIIGIDFGTTNCTMAYTPIQSPDKSLEQAPIAQAISAEMPGQLLSLPSFIYFPLPEEAKAVKLPERRFCLWRQRVIK